ncbi:MAG: acyl carrier protein [Planctomycetaceae bacterium]|nr:acyl carrier protein [Planctomycetaceae bacterium]
MQKTEFLELLDELFDLEPGTIQATDDIQKIPGWGSLSFVGLIALIDEEYGVEVSPTQILSSGQVSELIAHVEQALATRQAA